MVAAIGFDQITLRQICDDLRSVAVKRIRFGVIWL